LGVIIRLTLRASEKYTLSYTTETISFERFIKEYSTIWKSAEYVRAWWWPYTQKVIIWRGDRTTKPTPSPSSPSTLQKWSQKVNLGKKVYEASLYGLTYTPTLLPNFEKALFRTQFPSAENVLSPETIESPHTALQMDCLFSQYVDEWAIPLSNGPEAITRLNNYILHADTSKTGIPISNAQRVFVHAPIEIRVNAGTNDNAFLSPSAGGTEVVYIGVIMYRPYFHPVAYRVYFHAYETLMRSMGGKPHWAKQHRMSADEARASFGEGMERWLEVRRRGRGGRGRVGGCINGFGEVCCRFVGDRGCGF
jgi:D-arabinono-1,4-lactone oxidase